MAHSEDDEKTRIIRRSNPLPANDDETVTTGRKEPSSAPQGEESEMTRLIGPARRSPKQENPTSSQEGEVDPVVAWLVVLAGPGRGSSVKLGYGQNSLGRDREERCSLDFGDASISRQKHCFVIYEPRKREYFLRPGDSANLTYLNGDLVTEPKPLAEGSKIEIGKTTLLFVPFCGPDFDWQEQPEHSAKS